MSGTSGLLIRWCNNFGGSSIHTKANDGVAFATVSDDKEEQKKSGKKKEVTCFRCKKIGHYASECDEELPPKTPKSGYNRLIMDVESSTEQGEYMEEEVNGKDVQYCEGQEIEDDNQGNEENDDDTTVTMSECKEDDKLQFEQFDAEDYEGIVFTQKDVLCNMQEKAGIPASWILLDSQSTVDMFCNPKMLGNIWEAKRHLVLHCNAGTVLVTMKGDLKGYGTVWYHPTGIANILSLNNV